MGQVLGGHTDDGERRDMMYLKVNPKMPYGDAITVDGVLYKKGEQYQFPAKEGKEMLKLVWRNRTNLPIFVETHYDPPKKVQPKVIKADNADQAAE